MKREQCAPTRREFIRATEIVTIANLVTSPVAMLAEDFRSDSSIVDDLDNAPLGPRIIETIGVPDLRVGSRRLGVRFVQFDEMALEQLHYRESSQASSTGAVLAPTHTPRSPASPGCLDLCFHLRDDVTFNKFVHGVEAEVARRGMTHVRANRTATLFNEGGRKTGPLETMSNKKPSTL